jgi:hypothetical protein
MLRNDTNVGNGTLAVKDTFTAASHVFLVPDEGSSAVVALHSSLNSGQLAPIARPDIIFTPHVTVAALEEFEEAAAVADDLNARGVAIAGRFSPSTSSRWTTRPCGRYRGSSWVGELRAARAHIGAHAFARNTWLERSPSSYRVALLLHIVPGISMAALMRAARSLFHH